MPDEIESPFARDDNDELIRREEATRSQFEQLVTVTIDGRVVQVPKAVPLRDALGNFIRDAESNKIPRATTIYDAASVVFQREELQERIPVLCHQEHLHPIAVCRMCSVHLKKKDERRPSSKLFPACQHLVQDGMIVTTRIGPDNPKPEDLPIIENVKGATKVLAELLSADHLPKVDDRKDRYRNELGEQVAMMKADSARFNFRESGGSPSRNDVLHPKSRPQFNSLRGRSELPVLPYDSRSFQVNHDQCILCDRCVRSCSEVKPFKIIGHTGKGYRTRISFDLDLAMNESECVQCGECMTSCPTGAITLNRRVNPLGSWTDAAELEKAAKRERPDYTPNADDQRHDFPGLTRFKDPMEVLPSEFPSAKELPLVEFTYRDPVDGQQKKIRPFSLIPLTYLRWNEGGVRKREVSAGDVLCQQGDFGATAYLLSAGEFQVFVTPPSDSKSGGFLQRLFGKKSGSAAGENLIATVTAEHLIVGEMACLTNTARNATIRVTKPGVVYEVRRNLLTMMERTEVGRKALRPIYTRRAILDCIRKNRSLFKGLSKEQEQALQDHMTKTGELLKVDPGQTILREGDRVEFSGKNKNNFFLVRFGSLKVSRSPVGQEIVLGRLTNNDYFGEIALLIDPLLDEIASQINTETNAKRLEGLKGLRGRLAKRDSRVRSATITGLDTVELVRIPGQEFVQFLEDNPDVMKPFLRASIERQLERQLNELPNSHRQRATGEWVAQGFYQANKMLVLDLERCTRCDECTKACADSHPGPKEEKTSRLLREGPRFGKFLVATSCRSCHTPYCMDGCPVDSIHRGAKSLEIRVENHCIGCGLCAKNCPYESIQMLTLGNTGVGERRAADVRVAVNCDLCQDTTTGEEDPFCVAACPHDAAFRMDGEKLLDRVAPTKK